MGVPLFFFRRGFDVLGKGTVGSRRRCGTHPRAYRITNSIKVSRRKAAMASVRAVLTNFFWINRVRVSLERARAFRMPVSKTGVLIKQDLHSRLTAAQA
jgi:hypothetical protein